MMDEEPRPPRFRLGQFLLRTAAALGVAALLFSVAVVLLPKNRSFRGWVLSKIASKAREDFGISLRAKDFGLDLRNGHLTIEGVEVAASEGAPAFARLASGDAVLDVGALRRHQVLVRSLVLDGLSVDLSAPVPQPRTALQQPGARPYQVSITAFEVRNSEIRNGPGPQLKNEWVEAIEASGISLKGSFDGKSAPLGLNVPSVSVRQTDGTTIHLTLEARGEVTTGGPFLIEKLHLASGEVLDLSGNLSGDFNRPLEISGRGELRVSPAGVVPRLGVDGEYGATLDWKGPERAGLLTLVATNVHPESFEKWLPPRVSKEARLRGTALNLQSSIGIQLDHPSLIDGEAELHWFRTDEEQASLSTRITAASSKDEPSMLEANLSLLPSLPGRRQARGRVLFSRWQEITAATLRDGELTLDSPDLLSMMKELRTQWPDWIPEAALDPRLAGKLTARAGAEGPIQNPRLRASGTFEAVTGAIAAWDLSGRLSPREAAGTVELTGLPLSSVSPKVTGSLSASATLRFERGQPSGRIVATAADVCLEGAPRCLTSLSLTASGSPSAITVEAARAETAELTLDLSGSANAESFWQRAHVQGRLGFKLEKIAPIDFEASVRDGVLQASLFPIEERAGLFAASAQLPLGTLKAAPVTRDRTGFLPDGLPNGPLAVALSATSIDSCLLPELLTRFSSALGQPAPAGVARLEALTTQLSGSVSLALEADLENPDRSRARAVGDGLRIEGPAGVLTTSSIAELSLSSGEVVLAPIHVIGPETEFSLAGKARLAKGLLSGEPVRGALEWIGAASAGRLESSLLRPFLAGGVPAGQIEFEAEARGPLDRLAGSLKARGKELSILWPRPYVTKLDRISLGASFSGNGLVIESAEAFLNDGPVSLSGSVTLNEGLDLRAAFSKVRYRLAYGFLASLGGAFQLYFPWEGRRRLSGQVVLERGVLDRDIDLESELLRRLLAPPESRSSEPGLLDTLDLDIDVTSPSGVRIRNNLADLRATWDRISVSGTAAEPVIRGRIDIEPGGRVFAYQQIFRIDKGAITYTGDAASDPQLEFLTTSSFDDPSIARGESRATLDTTTENRADAANALAEGLATYFGERLTKRIGDALGGARILLRPVLVFGETDPGTRLTVAKDLSRNVLFAFSLDLKNAQRQTYLVDLHGLKGLPSLTAQIFTKEDAVWGGTLQQTISFGASKQQNDSAPKLASVTYDVPKALLTRSLKQTVRLGKGDPVPEEYPFDLEIEMASYLRDRGYPGAEVHVIRSPAKKPNTVDLAVSVRPGQKVTFVFDGEKPPRPSQAGITSLYMPGAEEEPSLLEMEAQTVRIFRSLGFPGPRVRATATNAEEKGQVLRLVTIETNAGAKAPVETVRFEGVTAEEADFLAARFSGPAERLELAAGGSGAKRRVLSSLALLGRPEARVETLTLSSDGRILTVGIEGGPYSRIATVTFEGVPAEEGARLRATSRISEGDVARSDLIALGSLRIEEALKDQGYMRARVRALLAPATPELVPPVRVRYAIDKGEPAILSGIRFDGRRYASRAFLERTAALSPGEPAVQRKLDEARARLAGTTMFSSIRSELRPVDPGKAEAIFTVEERPRFSIAYGLRWASDEGFAGVVDLLDQNLLGRAITLGVRGLYSQNHRSGRLYLASRNLLNSRVDLEGFVEVRRDYEALIEDTTEVTLQLSRPLARGLLARIYGKYQKSHQFEEVPDPTFPIDVKIAFPYLGSQVIWDTRDDPLFTNRGLLATADFQASGPFISSDFAYLRLFGQMNVYLPVVKWKNGPLTWAQSLRGGWARPMQGQELISDVLFYAGGDSSVRGYPLESLGPVDPLFGYLGGSRLFVLNEELRFPIFSRVSGLVFFDMGSVWNEGQALGDFLAKSTGIGLRGNTPLGILRGDLAFPLDRREGDPRIKFYFGFGNIF